MVFLLRTRPDPIEIFLREISVKSAVTNSSFIVNKETKNFTTSSYFQNFQQSISKVTPCTTAQFPRPARRPAHSVLAPWAWQSAGLTPLRSWEQAVDEYVEALQREAALPSEEKRA